MASFSPAPHGPTSILFPYTTLFRSREVLRQRERRRDARLSGVFDDRHRYDLAQRAGGNEGRSEEHTSELQSHSELVCRLLLEKNKSSSTVWIASTLSRS